jgi:ribosomal protein S18 acetylase RimI-like enzyme
MAMLDDVITYLEMHERPSLPRVPAPIGVKLALMRAEDCTVSFYRYLYETVGTPWLWYERRLWSDEALKAQIRKATTEIFVLHVGGVPAGYFELEAAAQETELCYFGLIPEFIGRGLGPFMLQTAIDRAWERPIARLWVHTRTFDHPKALGHYQRAGFVVYARRELRFEDPRLLGYLPRTLTHPRLPPLAEA